MAPGSAVATNRVEDNSGPQSIKFEDCRIIFRNFSGKEGQYNREGDRNFALLLDPEPAQQMLDAGWNVKFLRARDEDEERQAYIQVAVSYKVRPPRTVLITSRGRVTLNEEHVNVFDWIDIKMVDLIVNPYAWAVGDKTGIKAYLKSIFITMQEDELELKYSDIPEAGGQESALGILENDPNSMLAIEAGQDPNIIDAEIVYDED